MIDRLPSPSANATTKDPALITGASSGIGAAFARALARRGHGVVLVGRRRDRLESLADELREQFGVTAEPLAADLAQFGELDRVEAVAREAGPFEFLINNAGFGVRGRFAERELSKHLDMLRVHSEVTVRLSHAVLPGMITAGRGAIINVSSVMGILRSPGSTMYCATKGFLNAFSETLSLELRRAGIRVQALCPGFTVTEFHDRPEFAEFNRSDIPKAFWMSAHKVVEISLKALDRDQVICIPGLINRLLVVAARNPLTRRILKRLTRRREQRMVRGKS